MNQTHTVVAEAAPESPAFSVPAAGSLPALRSRRRPMWIAAGLLCLILGALGGIALYTQATNSQAVIQVLRPISRGEVIQTGDLGVVTIGAVPGVSIVSADEVADLIGQTARVDLEPRALLPEGAIGAPVVHEGQVQVGLRLTPGRLPLADLRPGSQVLLVPVPSANGSEPTHNSAISAVVSTGAVSTNDGAAMVLDVSVPREQAELVASLSATDNLTVVRVN